MQKFLPFLPPLFPLLAAPFAAQEAAQPAPPAHTFLWKVEREGLSTSWLLGTVHAPDARVHALRPEVREVLDAADAFYAELDLGDMAAVTAKILPEAQLPHGTRLEDLVTEEVWERLDTRLRKFGLGAQAMNGFKPVMVELTLTQLEMAPMLASGQKSLDERLFVDAKASNKEVGGVETVEEQVEALLKTLTLEESAVQLGKTLDDLDEADARGMSGLEQILRAWLTGSETVIERTAFAEFDLEDPLDRRIYDALVTRRNVRMAERSAERMRANPSKKFVFAFGTLHFVGAGSVVELLRKDGFTVTRMTAPTAAQEEALVREATWLEPMKELEPAGAGR